MCGRPAVLSGRAFMLISMELRHWAVWYTPDAPAGAPPSVSAHQVNDGAFDLGGRLLVWMWRRGEDLHPVWEVRTEHVIAYREYDTPVAAHVATFSPPPPDAVTPRPPLNFDA